MSDAPAYLTDWILGQRWYSGKGSTGTWERIGGFTLESEPGVVVRVHLLLDHSLSPLLYQVPVTERTEAVAGLEYALIGEVDGRFIYDGPHDQACAEAILRLILDEGTSRPDDGGPGLAARGHTAPGAPTVDVASARVLSGEQSNTSIIFETTTLGHEPGDPIICKVFRTLHHGENPDVTLLSALTGAGSTVVPRSVGHITGQWRDTGEATGLAHGHLAFAQEFLPGVEDAWRVALRAAESDTDFSAEARTLGEATADIHLTLASALPSHAATPADIEATLASMRLRLEQAIAQVPALEQHRGAIEALYALTSSAEWPAMQRIHGDYHLGQVLAVPGRGWVALDFEGEPLRPMHERAREDSSLRDVAGMLRSFDYAAGSVEQADPSASRAQWAASARAAFLDGYVGKAGSDLTGSRALLDALEVDKALYEAVYEARNRPGWLSIPLTAIERLVTRSVPR